MQNAVKLTEEELAEAVATLSNWKLEGQWLVRRFRFSAFVQSIAFVNQVAERAEAFVHHPLIAIDFKHVTLRLTTWHAGGLTRHDVQSALSYDALYETFGSQP